MYRDDLFVFFILNGFGFLNGIEVFLFVLENLIFVNNGMLIGYFLEKFI